MHKVLEIIRAVVREADPACPFNGKVVVLGRDGYFHTDQVSGTTYMSQDVYDLLMAQNEGSQDGHSFAHVGIAKH